MNENGTSNTALNKHVALLHSCITSEATTVTLVFMSQLQKLYKLSL